MWARNDHAPGAPRPASPWDEWTIPPKPAALTETREPGPQPAPAPFRPWRIDFARPEIVEYPERPAAVSPDAAAIAKRLLLLFGLAYLFIAALASGLACTGYFAAATGRTDRAPDAPGGGEPSEGSPAPRLPSPRPPSRHPDAPGLHTRPDGTRYLVVPLPADLADRLRDRVNAVHPAHAFGGVL